MSKFSCAEIGAALIIIFIFLLLVTSFPIYASQELVLSCFDSGSEICQSSGLEKIEIQNWQTTGGYVYFLRLENKGEELCQANLKLDSEFTNPGFLENINFTIKNYEEILFQDNLFNLLNSSAPLPNLLAQQTSSYRLIFSLPATNQEISIPFDLVINLDCQPIETLEKAGEVLGDKTTISKLKNLETENNKDEEEDPDVNYHPMKKITYYLKQFSIFAVFAFLFSFIFCLLKLLINSQKGGSDDKKQSKNV